MAYKINHTCFSPLTDDGAYWLGFLMADGCLPKSKHNAKLISICLQIGDYDHLVKWHKFVGTDKPIYVPSTRTNQCVSHVCSDEIRNALIGYGVTERKSLTAKFHNSVVGNRHLWRGMIDGDGCIHFDKTPQIALCGSQYTCEQYADFVRTLGIGATVKPHQTIYNVNHYGQKAISIMSELYRDCQVYLDRKKSIAAQLIASREKTNTEKQEADQSIANLKAAGMNTDQVARFVGIKRDTVRAALKRNEAYTLRALSTTIA